MRALGHRRVLWHWPCNHTCQHPCTPPSSRTTRQPLKNALIPLEQQQDECTLALDALACPACAMVLAPHRSRKRSGWDSQ